MNVNFKPSITSLNFKGNSVSTKASFGVSSDSFTSSEPTLQKADVVKALVKSGLSKKEAEEFAKSPYSLKLYSSIMSPEGALNKKFEKYYDGFKDESLVITPMRAYEMVQSGYTDFDSLQTFHDVRLAGHDVDQAKYYIERPSVALVDELTGFEAIYKTSPYDIGEMIDKYFCPELVAYGINEGLSAEELEIATKFLEAVYSHPEDEFDTTEFDAMDYFERSFEVPVDEIEVLMSSEIDEDGNLKSGLIRPLTFTEAAKVADTGISIEAINYLIQQNPDVDFGLNLPLYKFFELETSKEFIAYQNGKEYGLTGEEYIYALDEQLEPEELAVLIKEDLQTGEPLSGASRVLTKEEAAAALRNKVLPRQLDTFIEYMDNEGYEMYEAAFLASVKSL